MEPAKGRVRFAGFSRSLNGERGAVKVWIQPKQARKIPTRRDIPHNLYAVCTIFLMFAVMFFAPSCTKAPVVGPEKGETPTPPSMQEAPTSGPDVEPPAFTHDDTLASPPTRAFPAAPLDVNTVTAAAPPAAVAENTTVLSVEATHPEAVEEEKREDETKPAEATDEDGLSWEKIQAVREGMDLESVVELLGRPTVTVSKNEYGTAVYRWAGPKGISFIAKFENGVLTRKTRLTAVADPNSPRLTESVYNEVREGMTLEEVMEKLRLEAKTVAETSENTQIFQWTDAAGSTFVAKFQDGRLVRKTGLHLGRMMHPSGKPENGEAGTPESVTEGERRAEEMEQAQGENETSQEGAETPAESPSRWLPVAEASTVPADTAGRSGVSVNSAEPPAKPRVVRTGRSRVDMAQSAAEEPRPKSPSRVRLPEFRRSIPEGSYEVRIENRSGGKALVGIRTGKNGKDATVPPGGSTAFFVSRGQYEIYFIFDTEPTLVHRGMPFVIDGLRLTDVRITLFDDNYEVSQLDRSTELRSP